MKIQKKPEWLIVFYLQEVRDLAPYAKDLLDIIEDSRMKEHCEVWLLYEEIRTNERNTIGRFELVVYRLEVTATTSKLVKVPLSKFGIQKSDKTAWQKVLSYLYQSIQSQRRIFFTWSHGAGFGIHTGKLLPDDRVALMREKYGEVEGDEFAELSNTHRYLSQDEVAAINEGKAFPIIQPLPLESDEYQAVPKGVTFDCAHAEVLWMSDLAQGLTAALHGAQIDILVMMNCNMQLFENGYALKDAVKILVGATTKMWAYGYDYKKLLQLLNDMPDIGNIPLATRIIDDYVAMHQQLGHDDHLKMNVMVANSLEHYQNIAFVLSKTTAHLLLHWNEVKVAILKLKNDYFNSISGKTTLILLDIRLWIDTLYKTTALALPDPQDHAAFLQYIEQTVIQIHVGAEMIRNDSSRPKKYGASCSGLFFPIKAPGTQAGRFAWCEYFSRERTSVFQEFTGWGILIRNATAV